MTNFLVARVAQICGGILEGSGGGARVRTTEIDSRNARDGTLFVALRGTRTVGHRFLADAFERGAVAAIVGMDAPALPERFADRALIRVKYPKKALADLAAAHRATLRCPVIAVTGSNGKSSTREMIAKVLEPLGEVIQSEKSFNNDLGVPLTLLRAGAETAALVVEMGTNDRGEIGYLTEITRPDMGVITNVGAAHLERLRSEAGVAEEKGALAAGLPENGTLILNADDPRVVEMAARTSASRIITYSVERSTATIWGHAPERTQRGVAVWLYGKMRIELPVPGLHNLSNAMAAVAVGLAHGVTPTEIADGLATAKLLEMRMQVVTHGGATFVLDCYNANPASLEVAVDELAARAPKRRRVVVLGDMLELGRHAERLHHEAGAGMAGRIDVLWCVGPESKIAAEAAREAGLHPEQVFWSPTTSHAIEDLHVRLAAGDAVLFKGSRAMGLEALARALEERLVAEPAPPAVLEERKVKARKVG